MGGGGLPTVSLLSPSEGTDRAGTGHDRVGLGDGELLPRTVWGARHRRRGPTLDGDGLDLDAGGVEDGQALGGEALEASGISGP